MGIKYYHFNSSIGKMYLFFSPKGITSLHFPNKEEDEVLHWAKNNYGRFQEVDKEQYKFHHEIIEYLEGKREKFTLNLDIRGTEFQKKVWDELLDIPYGEVKTYKDIAKAIGCPKGFRAVGGALNKNPISIIIPCHRVIGSNGNLTGFGGGLSLKKKLLTLEGYL